MKKIKVKNSDMVLKCPGEWVTAMSVSPTDRTLVTGSDKGVIRAWELSATSVSSRQVRQFSSPVTALKICPDGSSAMVGTWDGQLVKLDLKAGKIIRKHEEHRETITTLDFSPDGMYLASGSADDRLIVWDVQSAEDLLTMHQGNEYDVTTLAFSPDGKTIATGDGENQLRLWDAENGEALKVLKGHREPVSQVVYDAKGTLISGSWDKRIRVWKGEKPIDLKGHTSEITALRVAGNDLFSADEDGFVLIWDLLRGSKVASIQAAQLSVRCLELLQKGKLVLAGTFGEVLGFEIS